ncbi:MAG TPA: Crp/Fnr family transcriptional regulator [Candidatus Saccharimonadia bacterium]
MSVYASQDLAEYIVGFKTFAEYQKRDVIIDPTEQLRRVYLVESGYVKTYDIDEAGNERTINIFQAGAVFPVVWLMAELPATPFFYYEALTSVRCALVDAWTLRQYAFSRPDVMRSLVDALVRSNINMAMRVFNLENSRVGERLDFVLLQLATRLGVMRGGVARLDVPITQEEIARLAGVTRESMSLELSRRSKHRPYWREGHATYIDYHNLNSRMQAVVMRDEPTMRSV